MTTITSITPKTFPKTIKPHNGSGGQCTWFSSSLVGAKDGKGAIAGQVGQTPATASMKAGQETFWLNCYEFGQSVPPDATVKQINVTARIQVTAGKAVVSRAAVKIPGAGFKDIEVAVGNLTSAWGDYLFVIPASVLDPGQDLDPAIARRIIADPTLGFALACKASENGTKVLVDCVEMSVAYDQEQIVEPEPDPLEQRIAALEATVADIKYQIAEMETRIEALEQPEPVPYGG